jgi:hypothetical protein
VDGEAGGLVEDEEVVVLVDDPEAEREGGLDEGGEVGEGLAGEHALAGGRPDAVVPDAARLDEEAGDAPGEVGVELVEDEVEARAVERGGDEELLQRRVLSISSRKRWKR